jgi:hypothetical protein
MHNKSNFKDEGVSPKMPASQGDKARIVTPNPGLHTTVATSGKHPFKPANPYHGKNTKRSVLGKYGQ